MSPSRQNPFPDNLAALAESRSSSTVLLERAELADNFRPAMGRDGSETFVQKNGADPDQWLGRTSMPSISAPALIEAFDPGLGNVLLYTFGNGAEVRLLIERLHPHQAVFVIEPDVAALRAALELDDFGAALRSGQLQLFAGEGAWRQMESFLVDNPGYLVPQRILARPWFDSGLVQNLRDRMTDLTERVAHGRQAADHSANPVATTTGSIAILSNRPDGEVRRWAADLAAGARRIDWDSARFVLDGPAGVEPCIAERTLRSGGCRAVLIIGASPQSLAYRLPAAPCAVLTLPGEPWPDWIADVSESCWIATTGPASTPRPRVVRIAYAVPDWCAETGPLEVGRKAGIVADYIDTSAEGAGLALVSHQHLWNAARKVLAESVDRSASAGLDMTSSALLREAEKRLGLELRAAEVRAGLEERIQGILLPAMFQDLLVRALKRSGREVILFGSGWQAAEGVQSRGWSPSHAESWEDIGSVFFPRRDWSSRQNALVAASLGIPAFVRGPLPAESDDPLQLLEPFATPGEAIKLLEKSAKRAGAMMGGDRNVRDEILKRHTWSACLGHILAAMGVSK